jgi:hypothetical protein
MVWQLIINEAPGLSHVDFFRKRTLKKGIVNVKLCNRPTMLKGWTENNADGSRLDNRAERLSVIETRTLMEAFSYKASFVPVNGAVWFSFEPKDPLTANQILMRRRRDQFPGAVTG